MHGFQRTFLEEAMFSPAVLQQCTQWSVDNAGFQMSTQLITVSHILPFFIFLQHKLNKVTRFDLVLMWWSLPEDGHIFCREHLSFMLCTWKKKNNSGRTQDANGAISPCLNTSHLSSYNTLGTRWKQPHYAYTFVCSMEQLAKAAHWCND